MSSSALEIGLDHLRRRRWAEGAAALREALGREPGRLAAVRGLATALLHGGDPAAARRLLEAFTRDRPMSAPAWRLAAQLEWKLGARPEAIDVLRRGLARLPGSALLRRQLTLFLAAHGALAEAAAQAEELGEGAEESTLAACVAAASGAGRGVLPTTEACVKDRAAHEMVDADLLDQIAGDPGLLDALLRLPGGSSEGAGAEASDRGVWLELEWKLGRLLEEQPHHPDRQVLLARLQIRLGAFTPALLSLQRALRSNPNLVEAHRLRARLHVQNGETDLALQTLQDLVKRGVAWPDIHVEIADLEQRRGRAEAARTHLRSAIKLNPRFDQAREMLARSMAA